MNSKELYGKGYRVYGGKDMAKGDELFFRQIKVIQDQFNG